MNVHTHTDTHLHMCADGILWETQTCHRRAQRLLMRWLIWYVRVCMCIYMHTCMYINANVSSSRTTLIDEVSPESFNVICARVYMYIHAHMHMCKRKRVNVSHNICWLGHSWLLSLDMYVYIHAYMYMYIQILYPHPAKHSMMFLYVRVYVCIYIYI